MRRQEAFRWRRTWRVRAIDWMLTLSAIARTTVMNIARITSSLMSNSYRLAMKAQSIPLEILQKSQGNRLLKSDQEEPFLPMET